jgi:hypothetical protein
LLWAITFRSNVRIVCGWSRCMARRVNGAKVSTPAPSWVTASPLAAL